FGGSFLFEDISFLINQKDRVGLAGKNGAGKSTLLKILAGEQKPQKGEVSKPNDCTIGYLPQDMVHNLGKTVFDETATAFDEVKKLEAAIVDITHQLETRTDYESDAYMNLITHLNEAHERLDIIGAGSINEKIELTLLGLGFDRKDFTRMTDEFSGGWRMRIELAKILLQKPNVMLLDEPTNHLDIESILWLEDFLKNYYGAVVMVSHDKRFLDNLTTRTIEISMAQIFDYRANYSKYLVLRKDRKEQQEAAARNQQKYIEKTQVLIDKYRAKANKASFAQSLIKKLDKLEIVEVDASDNTSIYFRFPPAARSGKVVVEAVNVKKQYGEKTIFSNVEFMIERGEKIAFVGRNGEGKSTMLKLIVGDQPITDGKITLGHNVNIGYYAQNQTETLDVDATVFDTVDAVAVGEIRKNVRSLLGSFLFSGDDIDKKVKVLSGGEKSRLAMCLLLLEPYNLLVLDEPTNHLDIRSKEVLKNALINYDGSMVIVSHDRDFLQGLTSKVYEFKNGNVKQHIGDITEYLETKRIDHLADLDLKQKSEVGSRKTEEKKVEKNNAVEEKQKQEKELKNIQNQISRAETEIARLENEIKTFDEKLADPAQYQNVVNDKAAFAKYEDLKKKLESEMLKWEELQGKAPL
ncbi:MAG: ABC-F family ATP-binding cassette domain-containing protein, partial [Bacteroidia bacterium]|nr:ABC-F family ATP-binding cassette domain-containing protein [Bacteroidia bacterium]